GSFNLKFLPPGSYKVLVAPLNQAVTEQNLSTSWYRNLNTNFGATYYGNVSDLEQAAVVDVTAGVATSGITIQVLPKNTSALNLTRPGIALRIPRNAFSSMTIGGYDVTSGTQFSISDPEIFLESPIYGGSISSAAPTSATFDVSVSPNATLGPKNISVMRGLD